MHKNEPVLGRTLLSWFGQILMPESWRVCRLEMNQIEKVKELKKFVTSSDTQGLQC